MILANLGRTALLIFLIDPDQGSLLCDSWSLLSSQVPGIPTSYPFPFALPQGITVMFGVFYFKPDKFVQRAEGTINTARHHNLSQGDIYCIPMSLMNGMNISLC